MPDVMFYEVFKEEEKAIKKYLPDTISAGYTPLTVQEKNDDAAPAAVISTRTQSVIPAGWANDIKAILSRSTGYDHLLSLRRELKGDIAYGYIGNYCARAVGEQAVLMLMALLRKLKKQTDSFVSFSRDGMTGYECKGRRIIVLGVGHIGNEIVDIARGLSMDVKGFDIEQKINDLDYVTLEEGLAWADDIVCALPLTEDTRGMLSYDVLKKAGSGATFVNIARGEIAPVGDLKRLLDENFLEAIGLDVYSEEAELAHDLRAGSGAASSIIELSRSEKVLFTPHNAFNTQEALEAKARLSVDAVMQFLKNKTFPQPVPSE